MTNDKFMQAFFIQDKFEQRITFATAKKSKIFGSRKSKDFLGKVKSKSIINLYYLI